MGGSAVAVIVVLGFLAGAAMTLRTTERLARAGRLDEHGVRVLTRLTDRLVEVVRLVIDAFRSWLQQR